MDTIRDKIRGSLVGGAAGDALGYSVEFFSEKQIFDKYGENGIVEYELDSQSNCALISDDTQMSLFTANALLFGRYRQKERGISGNPRSYALHAYLGWLQTQEVLCYSEENKLGEDWCGWTSYMLKDIPELYARRAPGITCLNALKTRRNQVENNEHIWDFVASKINDSKGCGGIMRVAPLGMSMNALNIERLDEEGAQLAAITHSHSLGYMPAAVLTHIVNRIIYSVDTVDLKSVVEEARDTVAKIYKDDPHIGELTDIIDRAISLSENNGSDIDNIHKLGEGWVAEETLAIAIYCCLRHKDSFADALVASVNHKGDSDSTGAVTGNIIGAIIGYEAIDSKWKNNLELHDLILKIADAIYTEFNLS